MVILSCYQLSIYYTNEIKRGFGNTGNYKLKTEFNGFFIDCLYQTFRESIEPSKIIESLISDTDEMLSVAGVEIETVDGYQLLKTYVWIK